MRSDSFATTLV